MAALVCEPIPLLFFVSDFFPLFFWWDFCSAVLTFLVATCVSFLVIQLIVITVYYYDGTLKPRISFAEMETFLFLV
jgi:hypothetical protein